MDDRNRVEEKRTWNLPGRRSAVLGTHAAVSCSQPLASEIGYRILTQKNGNAADAAVAMAAALNVLEPVSTGIGGDCFALYYNAQKGSVEGLNGSGKSPKKLTLDKARYDCLGKDTPTGSTPNLDLEGNGEEMDPHHIHSVTVPGAAAGWADTLEKWGTLSLAEVLAPAITLARDGFPVSPITSHSWQNQEGLIKRGPYPEAMLLRDPSSGELRAPKAGEIMTNRDLADTFESLSKEGKKGFYEGRIARGIVELVQSQGGCLELDDLYDHTSETVDPISVDYKGLTVWEIPPNGQGLTALIALNILNSKKCPVQLGKTADVIPSADDYHVMIEALRLAFADTRYYCTDQNTTNVPVKELLSKEYASSRAKLIERKAAQHPKKGYPTRSCDTVSFQVVDCQGNAMSFINSNYMGFGSGLIPKGCGFTLQNRGHNFSLSSGHPNQVDPGKRPYHTIIPGMLTTKSSSERGRHLLYATFSNMGGFMQPQGHVQLVHGLWNMQYGPQEALDAPRFCIPNGTPDGSVCLEQGMSEEIIETLRERGHKVVVVDGWQRAVFGRGQIIKRADNGVLWAGSDGRADGCAIAY